MIEFTAVCIIGLLIYARWNYGTSEAMGFTVGENGPSDITFRRPLSFALPFLKRFDKPLINTKASEEMRQVLKILVESRKKAGEKKKDFLQQIVEWMDRLDTPEFKNNNVSEDTFLFQAIVFYFAGQDQLSAFIPYAILSISQNKEIEKKVYEEMEKHLEKHDQQLKYENLHELTYLSACLTEATRMVPVFTRLFRVCTKDWERDGLRIKKRTNVHFPVWAANRNPQYFPDPETFNPERFMPENKHKLHQYAMSSFGFGPKNCIGMKFSTDLMIFTAAHLIKNFRFIPHSDTKLEYVPGNLIVCFCKPYYLDVIEK